MERIDTCYLECIYSHQIIDPEMDMAQKEEFDILQIGEKFAKYFDYGRYRFDSISAHIDRSRFTMYDFTALFNQCNPKFGHIIKDIHDKRMEDYGYVFIDRFVYVDSVTDLNWNTLSETKMVCGYQCYKATCTFRGRDWVAWYSDLPIPSGPWKFCGLPGLILQVEDLKGEHVFSAVSVRPSRESINKEIKKFMVTNRKKFNRALSYYMNNSAKVIANSPAAPKNLDGSPKVLPNYKRFYNPIEKDE